MRTPASYGDEAGKKFKGLNTSTQAAIATIVAGVVREVRREFNYDGSRAIESFIRLTDKAAFERSLFDETQGK